MDENRLPVALATRLLQPGTIAPATQSIGLSAKGRLDRRRLFRVLDYIDGHLEGDLTLDEMASVACLSRFHFARAFKQAVGQSPHRYVIARRLERAEVLLTEGETPLVEIALSLRFSSQANFSRAFRQSTGMAPGQYRREVTVARDINALRVRSGFREAALASIEPGTTHSSNMSPLAHPSDEEPRRTAATRAGADRRRLASVGSGGEPWN